MDFQVGISSGSDMKVISVLDTAITSYNLGNQIIMEAVYDIVEELFPEDFMFSLPWEGHVSKASHRYMRTSDYIFFGGTNSLSSHMLRYKQMGFRVRDLVRFNQLTLLGMGWWQYQDDPDLYSRLFIKRLLSPKTIHSVRDSYTKQKLLNIGVNKVVNTSCPTTWALTPDHCSKINQNKGVNVVLTLTDYNKSREADSRLLEMLSDSYERIHYWVQGIGDFNYINSFGKFSRKISIIPPRLSKYDRVLDTMDCDYIGTRLHAGIRAIQRQRRALILSVDNRAKEISRDIGLNVLERDNYSGIKRFINDTYVTNLNIPFEDISRWKAQFA
jgi:hypothetical protein